MSRSVDRRIYFYRLADGPPQVPLVRKTLIHIDGLEWNEDQRYLVTVDPNAPLALFIDKTDFPCEFRFGRCRRNDLPQKESGGQVTALGLNDEESLIDVGHIVLFEDGICAVEYNRFAPSMKLLQQYLSIKTDVPFVNTPTFIRLYRREILPTLPSYDRIASLTIEAPVLEADALRSAAPDLGSILDACGEVGSTHRAQFTLKAERGEDLGLFEKISRLISSSSARDALTKLSISGAKEGQLDSSNLLEEYLMVKKVMIKLDDRTKALHAQSTYAILKEAYRENYDSFKGAATIQDEGTLLA